ncbi:4-hydroxy-tetrahydrodipicolinate reductase [Striga asiatica]|uniref:4-hydroxy-tetrahydrodipicolinate reductase n=1 Tax=Striga asiatica TaxID=4170 RepID=A0A5A7NW09_STRAF|nr:4-hydroxy-tetrahydrodipicolinate reductase [Striga asiatica]
MTYTSANLRDDYLQSNLLWHLCSQQSQILSRSQYSLPFSAGATYALSCKSELNPTLEKVKQTSIVLSTDNGNYKRLEEKDRAHKFKADASGGALNHRNAAVPRFDG